MALVSVIFFLCLVWFLYFPWSFLDIFDIKLLLNKANIYKIKYANELSRKLSQEKLVKLSQIDIVGKIVFSPSYAWFVHIFVDLLDNGLFMSLSMPINHLGSFFLWTLILIPHWYCSTHFHATELLRFWNLYWMAAERKVLQTRRFYLGLLYPLLWFSTVAGSFYVEGVGTCWVEILAMISILTL